ncbi:MAG TPA: IMP dehydrogenase [Candidatus Nitrosopelagicus sp.]|nr:IMP dehydrogenase [Candidatus Nitrosopelagicus sp.]
MSIREGITFDDVLLVPKFSSITSRSETDLSTRLSKNISLNIPLISANMDTVTESTMAVTMAREGGIGIIHRFLTIEEQANQVLKVKRSGSVMIENPYQINDNQTISTAFEIMNDKEVSGLLVVNSESKLVGILTERDVLFESPNSDKLVNELMTKDVVTSKPNTTVSEAKEILKNNRIEKLPLIDDNRNIHGLFSTQDILNTENYPNASKDKKGRPLVGAAVGVKGDFLERTEALLEANTDVIVVDIAHGHSENAITTVKNIKKAFPNCELIAGNVATAQGTEDLIKAGVDAVKVGVGSGSICITRVITGSGVPQLTAVMDCAEIAKKYDIPIISDGGTKTSGDATKALAGGASTVMLGSMLSGTDESPGSTISKNGKRYKIYRGMASLAAARGRKSKETGLVDLADDLNDYVAEGVEGFVPYKGTVTDILKQITGGIRSGLSYCGGHTISQMQENAEFIKMSGAGFAESKPHDVDLM